MFAFRMSIYVGICVSFFLFGNIASADIFRFKDENGVWHFTNIKNDVRYKLFIKTYAKKPEKFIKDYGLIIDKASEEYGVDPFLIKAVIKAESDFNSEAVSKKGAKGLMQLMPGTANDMAVEDPFNPEENIVGGTRYLSELLNRFNKDKRLALAAYNAGPEKVQQYQGVPPFKETKAFVNRVLHFYEQYQTGTR